ncbi:hypothetical protein [Streptomyces acidiscabies]|uniref:hypothetical protein n=1 Tax=Streptomyces acidiscabies TaxID=42234 RepID=UPI000950EF19|nr:hypothetical protein [Streptomyces acidiscabies]
MAANARTARRSPNPEPRERPTRERVVEPEEATEADAQETESDGSYVTAQLAGEDIRIIPPGAWRQSWHRLLNAGQFDEFAETVMHPDDVDAYFDIDPTNSEFNDFIADAANQAGEGLGKSRGPARSSRRTRRR